jgi:hypothetical protein
MRRVALWAGIAVLSISAVLLTLFTFALMLAPVANGG